MLVRARRASLDLLVSPCLEDRRHARSRVAPRSRGSPAAAGGCASRPPSRARRSSAGAGRHRARSRARGIDPPTRPRWPGLGMSTIACRSVIGYLLDRWFFAVNGPGRTAARRLPPCNGRSAYTRRHMDVSHRVVVQTEQEPQTAGELIRFWRTRRGLSQLELSLDANVSTKHLSFVETGRSQPESPAPRPPGPAPRPADRRAQSPAARGRLRASLSGAALRRGGDAAAAGVARAGCSRRTSRTRR